MRRRWEHALLPRLLSCLAIYIYIVSRKIICFRGYPCSIYNLIHQSIYLQAAFSTTGVGRNASYQSKFLDGKLGILISG